MDQYMILTGEDRANLTKERVLWLEAEHFRLGLELGEAVDPEAALKLRNRIRDLDRRLTCYRVIEQAEAEGVGQPADGETGGADES